jgi:lipopolysaccharide export LptBFGC system permease protein LptF
MSPSDDEILHLWELYHEAEDYISEISSIWNGLDATAVNQLRYSGRHLLNALTKKTSVSEQEEYRRSVNHAKRAIFDALDSGIIYFLQKVELFKTDYRKIEITTPAYQEIIASARRAKLLLDEARGNFDNRQEYYEDARQHFQTLKKVCETLEDSRPEQNKRLRAYNRNILMAWATLAFTTVAAVFTALAYYNNSP